MTIFTKVFTLFILSTTLISCDSFSAGSHQQVTSTPHPISSSSTPKPLTTATSTPSITPTASITSSPISVPICVPTTSSTDGWDCLNQNYGFRVHFPSTAGNPIPLNDTAIVWLENSPSNPRVSRMLSIALGKTAESCTSSDLETKQIGELNFSVNHGFEPSGVVYEWRSYATVKDTRSICFMFIVGFETWEQDDPLFPPEEDQGLDEVEEILSTFQWLNL